MRAISAVSLKDVRNIKQPSAHAHTHSERQMPALTLRKSLPSTSSQSPHHFFLPFHLCSSSAFLALFFTSLIPNVRVLTFVIKRKHVSRLSWEWGWGLWEQDRHKNNHSVLAGAQRYTHKHTRAKQCANTVWILTSAIHYWLPLQQNRGQSQDNNENNNVTTHSPVQTRGMNAAKS